MRSLRQSILAPCVAFAFVAAAQAQTMPASITEHDVIAKMVAFNDRFVVDAYKKAGRRSPKWDVDATAFLTAQGRDGVSDGSDVFYRADDRMPLADRVALGRKARDAGCDDPLVLYHLGQALEAIDESREAADAYAAANASVGRGADCAKLFELLIYVADWRANRRDNVERRPAYFELLRGVLTDRATLPAHRRAVWNLGSAMFSDDDATRLLALGDAIDDLKDADPWLYGTLMGRVEVQRAWKARGGGWANSVTPDGWKQFAAHLVLARGHFEKAITADDTHPQPFAQMITVAMAESSGLERPWFDNAIARQSDYLLAYTNYRYSLLPRWSGTHVKMFELGIEAVDAGQFDTRAPSTLLDAIAAIEADMEVPLDRRQMNRVYPQIVRCLDGYIEHNPRPAVQRWARSKRAAWAARLEKWDEAQAQFDALRAAGATPRDDAFAGINLDAATAQAQAALFTGTHADEARAAGSDVTKIDALIAKLGDADASVAWLRERRATADIQSRMAGGEWTPISLDLAGAWRVETGDWSVVGDALVGKPANGLLSIVSRFELPERYEVRCTLVSDGQPGQVNVGIAWAPRLPVVAMLYAGDKGFLTRQYNYGEFAQTRDAAGTLVLHARVDGGDVSILDARGEPIASHDFVSLPTRRLSFGLPIQIPSDATWRFAKIEVRALPEKSGDFQNHLKARAGARPGT